MYKGTKFRPNKLTNSNVTGGGQKFKADQVQLLWQALLMY